MNDPASINLLLLGALLLASVIGLLVLRQLYGIHHAVNSRDLAMRAEVTSLKDLNYSLKEEVGALNRSMEVLRQHVPPRV